MRLEPTSESPALRPALLKAAASILSLAALTLAGLGLAAGPASAAPAQGEFTMTLGGGNAGNALNKAGVKIGAIAPARQTATEGGSKGRTRVTLPLGSITEGAGTSTYAMDGGITFTLGKRRVAVRDLELVAGSTSTSIAGSHGERRLNLFSATGGPTVDQAGVRASVRAARLTLTPAAARLIRTKLRLQRLPAAAIGSLDGAVRFAFEDPYLDRCAIGAGTRTFGTVTPGAPAPVLAGPGVLAPSAGITWAIRAGLNGYVNSFARPIGIDGATVNPFPGPPNPAVPPASYTFVAAPGQYAANNPGTLFDDQAVVNSTGGVIYCNTAHGFRITISNPTVVINGSASRLIADIDTNISADAASGLGDWMPTQRVDLARLDLSGVTPVESGGVLTWPLVPTFLTDAGSSALRLCEVNVPGAPPNCLYPPGTVFAPITVAVPVTP